LTRDRIIVTSAARASSLWRIKHSPTLGVDRTLDPILTIGGQEGAKISQSGVAVFGL
jgi:hypothetical protein